MNSSRLAYSFISSLCYKSSHESNRAKSIATSEAKPRPFKTCRPVDLGGLAVGTHKD